MSIELSLEDVKKVAFHYGFELEVPLIVVHHYPGQNTFSPLSWIKYIYAWLMIEFVLCVF